MLPPCTYERRPSTKRQRTLRVSSNGRSHLYHGPEGITCQEEDQRYVECQHAPQYPPAHVDIPLPCVPADILLWDTHGRCHQILPALSWPRCRQPL